MDIDNADLEEEDSPPDKPNEDNVALLVSNMIEVTDYFCKPTEQFLNDDNHVSHIATILTDSIVKSMLIPSGNKCILQIVKYLRNIHSHALDFSTEGTLLQIIRNCNEDELLQLSKFLAVKVPGLSDNVMFQKALLHAFEGTHMMWTAICNILKYTKQEPSVKKFIFSKIREAKENSLPSTSMMEEIILEEPSLLSDTVTELTSDVLKDTSIKHTDFEEYMRRPDICFLISWSSQSPLVSRTLCNILYDCALTAASNSKLSAFIGYLLHSLASLQNSTNYNNMYSSKYQDLVFYLTIDPSSFPAGEISEHLIFRKCFVLKLLICSLLENPPEIIPLIIYHREWYEELVTFSLEHKLYVFERLCLNTSLFTLNV